MSKITNDGLTQGVSKG